MYFIVHAAFVRIKLMMMICLTGFAARSIATGRLCLYAGASLSEPLPPEGHEFINFLNYLTTFFLQQVHLCAPLSLCNPFFIIIIIIINKLLIKVTLTGALYIVCG